MALSWNEIKNRAVVFSKEWQGTSNEEADAKPFLEAFFNVFGITRKRIGFFEHRVKKLNDADGYIDLLWKGVILIEMKSLGKNLDKAFAQAKDYIHGLKEHEVPKYVLVSDFDVFRLFDTEENQTIEFSLKELVSNVQHFAFIAGYQKHIYKEQDPVNIQAAELMGKLHDKLKTVGYSGHSLEVYLVRLLFCLFADDTTIFEKDIFKEYVEIRTSDDGSDLAAKLSEVFYILNTPRSNRLSIVDDSLNTFPYVNGKLFEEHLPHAAFDAGMRKILLECCGLNWGTISPAIFGSMFQSVMNPQERRNLGAHYTSEVNILKLIKPLFLDELRSEFDSVKSNKNKLVEFHKKLSNLKFLDPACGCGNFLVITYRELRLLEIDILRTMNKGGVGFLDVREIIWLDVDMMVGIEFEEFPARIAEVGMWLIDHQMNMAISQEFGQYFVRLPLKKAATIIQGDALTLTWEKIISKSELSYILGNPPFIGSKMMKPSQRGALEAEFGNASGSGVLDYVAGWYIKAAKFVKGTKIKVAFVSTSSICQGEQVGILWKNLFTNFAIKIHFAYSTFKWANEARGNAAVHVVIVGFASFDLTNKKLFEHSVIDNQIHEKVVPNISPYLIDGNDTVILSRQTPLCQVPQIGIGNQPIDGGQYLFTDEEKKDFIEKEPNAEKFFRRWIGSDEFLNGYVRWVLWLGDAKPEELKKMPFAVKRVEAVRELRKISKRANTQKLAETPTRFQVENIPKTPYLVIPEVSSERRRYIPIGFENPETFASNLLKIIPNANDYHFGILESLMHMVWIKFVCGRLESRYRYSKDIVYNNFPWPESPSDKNKDMVRKAAREILETREEFPHSTLSDLYDPNLMPVTLTKAHQSLDRAVDLCYRPQPFPNETKRIEFLFNLYEKLNADLFSKSSSSTKRIKKDN